MFYVYAISSLTRNYIYVGHTDNVDRRVGQHNSSKESTTRSYRPFQLIMVETIEGDRKMARAREKYWKSGTGKERLRKVKEEPRPYTLKHP